MSTNPPANAMTGLVEIAALTALVGSVTAESLILGSRGAAGLPWASMSAFGSLFMIRACIAAATPSWLRDTLGVRNSSSDAAVGLSLNLKRAFKGTKKVADAVGIQVFSTSKRDRQYPEQETWYSASAQLDLVLSEDVYVFDTYTARALLGCLPSIENAALQPYLYVRDHAWQLTPRRRHQRIVDWVTVGLSLIKLTECYIFWYLGARTLALATGLSWAFFFSSAVLLQAMGISREDLHFDQDTTYVDILTGQLPTNQVSGDHGKIIFGMPLNPRRGWVWRCVWAVGGLQATASLASIYLLLGKQRRNDIYIWVGFQLLWLVCRTLFFHFATETDDLQHMVSKITDANRPPNIEARMLALIIALSKYQILVHPRSSLRGTWCYIEDMHTMPLMKDIFRNAGWEIHRFVLDPPGIEIGAHVEIEILGIISDTILSSVSWVQGSKLTPLDLYDSILLQIKTGSVIRLVPAARALGRVATPIPKTLSEIEAPSFPRVMEKGATNDGTYVSWAVWIPLAQDRWAQFSTPEEDIKLLGKRIITAVSGKQVTERLVKGDLAISLMTVNDVEDVIQKAVSAGNGVCRMLDHRVKM